MIKKQNNIASALLLAALFVGLASQPGWCSFSSLSSLYSQCDIVIDPVTNFISPVGLALLPDGRLIVASHFGLYAYAPLPTVGNDCTTNVTKLNGVRYYGIALGLDGKLYANEISGGPNTGSLVTVDTSSGGETLVLAGVNGVGMALDPLTGDLYTTVCCTSSQVNRIFGLYGPHPHPVVYAFANVPGDDLDGLAWSCDGTMLLVAADDASTIVKIDRTGKNINPNFAVLPSGTRPDGIAFGAAGTALGDFFFVNSNNGTVTKILTANPTNQQIIASNGYRGDFVSVDAQGNLLLTQHDNSQIVPDRITRLSSTAGGQWVLPGSTLCSTLGCGAKASTTNQEGQEEAGITGLDASLVLTLSQSVCGSCEGCDTLNQARTTLIALLNSLSVEDSCADAIAALKQSIAALYQTCPCTPKTIDGVSVCSVWVQHGGGGGSIQGSAKPTLPFVRDLQSYDLDIEAFMNKLIAP